MTSFLAHTETRHCATTSMVQRQKEFNQIGYFKKGPRSGRKISSRSGTIQKLIWQKDIFQIGYFKKGARSGRKRSGTIQKGNHTNWVEYCKYLYYIGQKKLQKSPKLGRMLQKICTYILLKTRRRKEPNLWYKIDLFFSQIWLPYIALWFRD